jgi:uncharacterized protein YfaS (alpha-2-macroglobulin family)
VTVTPDRERASPGERVGLEVLVRDHQGRPVPGAEVSVAVVDKAVLSLAQEVGANGMRAFWFERRHERRDQRAAGRRQGRRRRHPPP